MSVPVPVSVFFCYSHSDGKKKKPPQTAAQKKGIENKFKKLQVSLPPSPSPSPSYT